MTKIFSKNHNDFYDDYTHHPTEIRSILEGKMLTKMKILSVLSHTDTQGIIFKNEFAKSFKKSI